MDIKLYKFNGLCYIIIQSIITIDAQLKTIKQSTHNCNMIVNYNSYNNYHIYYNYYNYYNGTRVNHLMIIIKTI